MCEAYKLSGRDALLRNRTNWKHRICPIGTVNQSITIKAVRLPGSRHVMECRGQYQERIPIMRMLFPIPNVFVNPSFRLLSCISWQRIVIVFGFFLIHIPNDFYLSIIVIILSFQSTIYDNCFKPVSKRFKLRQSRSSSVIVILMLICLKLILVHFVVILIFLAPLM